MPCVVDAERRSEQRCCWGCTSVLLLKDLLERAIDHVLGDGCHRLALVLDYAVNGNQGG